MTQQVYFRFHGILRDFMDAGRHKDNQQEWILYSFDCAPSVKDAIESLGPPHPEVGYIVASGKGLDFHHKLVDKERLDIYPLNAPPETGERILLGEMPGDCPNFILDVHLGGLARYLRMAGFDSWYQLSDPGDKSMVDIAEAEGRILLTRDIGLLKHARLHCGYWLRSTGSRRQFREVVHHYGLGRLFKPFSRCTRCNGKICPVSKESIAERLLPETARVFDEFRMCTDCNRIYWKGSHYTRMCQLLESVFDDANP